MVKKTMDIEQRVAAYQALQRYQRAVARFEEASQEFNEACQSVRNTLPRECQFAANISHEYYLVNVDKDGSFSVEPLEIV